MRAKAFIQKFPEETEIKENCLVDLGCPNCGNRECLHIEFTGTACVFDDGSDDEGDHEWDSKSTCRCGQCDHAGSVREFTHKGLDDLLYQNQPVTDAERSNGPGKAAA